MDYVPNKSTLLSFKKGAMIRLLDNDEAVAGMLYGAAEGNEGYFPAEHVVSDESQVSSYATIPQSLNNWRTNRNWVLLRWFGTVFLNVEPHKTGE